MSSIIDTINCLQTTTRFSTGHFDMPDGTVAWSEYAVWRVDTVAGTIFNLVERDYIDAKMVRAVTYNPHDSELLLETLGVSWKKTIEEIRDAKIGLK